METEMKAEMKVSIAGLKIDAIRKSELLGQIAQRVKAKQKTFVATPYSEFLYASLRQQPVRNLLNSADFSLADGVGILWAQLFMSVPLTWPGFYLKILQAWVQMVWTGAAILLRPSLLYKVIPEKIVGADLIWDLAKLAADNNFNLYLLGARKNIAELAAKKLQEKEPGLKIVGTSNKEHADPSIIDDIKSTNADMIFVAFNGLEQEQWIVDNLAATGASFGIGLGGTFDYIAGAKQSPPKFIRQIGLEWLYRLLTQPSRIFRIYRGFWGLIISLVRVKVFFCMPLRTTVAVVVVNKDNKVLLCKQSASVTKKFYPHKKDFESWQWPQGGLDVGEEIIAGAQRELKEETGIFRVKSLGVAEYRMQYEWQNALRPFLTSHYKNRGADLHTVFLRFLGTDDEIQLDNDELEDYAWVNIEDVEKIIGPERSEHASIVLAELVKLKV